MLLLQTGFSLRLQDKTSPYLFERYDLGGVIVDQNAVVVNGLLASGDTGYIIYYVTLAAEVRRERGWTKLV